MSSSLEQIQVLVDSPRESLAIELKDWFNPNTPDGQAKVVRTCIAMRNRNGGYFLIGFDDNARPNVGGYASDVRTDFHADEINKLVNRYASEKFEVHVYFPVRGGQEFPVLEVDTGVKTPVASKSDLFDSADQNKLIKANAVYARTLSSNNTPSTTEARCNDWAGIVEICFDNREADVGRFLRRHLDRRQLDELGRQAEAAVREIPAVGPPPEVRTITLLDEGRERFRVEMIKKNLTRLPQHGSWETAVVFAGDVQSGPPTEEFLNLINASNPRYTGWPVWIDSRGFVDEAGSPDLDAYPYPYEGGWEAFIYGKGGGFRNRLDFWRTEPAGRFYLYRALQDDLAEGRGYPEPMTTLDPFLAILRTVEAIAVPMAFARAMDLTPEESTLHYAFRWSGLEGRELSSWTNPGRFVSPGYVCRQHEARSLISIPLSTPVSAIAPFVREATADLLAAFGGYAVSGEVIENLTERLLTRNL